MMSSEGTSRTRHPLVVDQCTAIGSLGKCVPCILPIDPKHSTIGVRIPADSRQPRVFAHHWIREGYQKPFRDVMTNKRTKTMLLQFVITAVLGLMSIAKDRK